MPSIIEILLTATDQTGPGFASARANLQAFVTGNAAAFAQMSSSAQAAGQQVATGAQAATQAQTQQAAAARNLATIQQQQARADLQVALASTDAAGKVQILTQNYERLSVAARQAGLSEEAQARATLAATNAQRQLITQQNVTNRGLGPALPRTLEQFGTGALAQAGIGLGAAVLGQQLVQLSNQSIELATRAQTIGPAYEEATRRAGVGADALLVSLREASRGTINELNLQLNANKALGLGVGQNIQQISDLLAIARQRGKAFGIDTGEAFQRIVEGLGKAEPEILDELGILLDSNKVYKEYAKSIGISANELTKQQKVYAVTNEVIRTNQRLISQNAQTQPDAADKAAAAIARQETAQIRLGQALLPVKTAWQETFATILEGLTGITRETDRLAQRNLLAGSSNLEDYRAQARKRTQELYASGNVIAARQNAMDMPWRSEYDAARAQAVAQAQVRAGEARTARDDRYGAAAAAATVQPRTRYAPYSNLAGNPAQQAAMGGGVTNIYNINMPVHGALVHTGDVIDTVRAGIAATERRGGVTGWGGPSGSGRRR